MHVSIFYINRQTNKHVSMLAYLHQRWKISLIPWCFLHSMERASLVPPLPPPRERMILLCVPPWRGGGGSVLKISEDKDGQEHYPPYLNSAASRKKLIPSLESSSRLKISANSVGSKQLTGGLSRWILWTKNWMWTFREPVLFCSNYWNFFSKDFEVSKYLSKLGLTKENHCI